jgi:hypothetical protein
LFGADCHFFETVTIWPNIAEQSGPNGTQVEVTIGYYCSYDDKYESFMTKLWPWIDACLGDFIPFIVVLVGNVAIVVKLKIASRRRAMQTQATAIAAAGGKESTRGAASKKVIPNFLFTKLLDIENWGKKTSALGNIGRAIEQSDKIFARTYFACVQNCWTSLFKD